MLTTRDGEANANDKKVYSLPNIHGDIMRTANAAGTKNNDYFYSPYGQMLEFGYNNLVTPNTPTVGQPYNAYTYTNFSWVGKHQKFDESSFVLNPIQMGARVYIPGIGRFLQADPQEGGVENNYVYPPDPVNEFDLDGNRAFGSLVKNVTRVASVGAFIPGPIGMISSGVASAGYIAQGKYGEAAIAAIGITGIPGGAAAKLASKSKIGTKITTKIIDKQATAKGIGVNSKLFGYAAHGTQSIGNSALPNITKGYVRIGWAQGSKRGSIDWRVASRSTKFLPVKTSYKINKFRR